ncbi:hypothetical protein OSL35_27205, partial [Escherichia coli]|nr:hypothetical protein [Escherichia coli]
PTTYLVDTTLSNSSDSDQTVQAVRLHFKQLRPGRNIRNSQNHKTNVTGSFKPSGLFPPALQK